MPQQLKATSTQQHIEIAEIKDSVVVMKNKGLRAVLLCSSINFALKSTDEQDALIYKYQGFLNSLDFSAQIMVASRKFNIDPYISRLKLKEREQTNELLRIQTTEYIEFIKGLTQMTNIMTESFYLIVPYNPLRIEKTGLLDKITGKKSTKSKKDAEQDFQELKSQLWQRVEFVASGLSSCGLRVAPLDTKELIELYYKLYNPSAKGNPELDKARQMRIK